MVLRNETPPGALDGDVVDKALHGYVGFANLPNQVFRKSVKRGFEFTLMVVGKFSSLLLLPHPQAELW